MPIAILNMGGVRGEDAFFSDLDPLQKGAQGVRVDMSTEPLLPMLVLELRKSSPEGSSAHEAAPGIRHGNSRIFKDMLS